jgi:murein DD-endopeptidase MepM/ murein hydrolase activator NlpD
MRNSIRAITLALAVSVVLPAAAAAYWPVANVKSYITQGYSSQHRAYDIASWAGTRIVPTRSGTVVFAGYRDDCGARQVWVYHGNGLYSAYYHMKAVYAYRGQWVTGQMTTLGLVGQSGCATGPHLHFEVWKGRPWTRGSYRINPWPYMDSGKYEPYRYR